MKELKFNLAQDLFRGFSELQQLLQVHKFYIESLTGKPKDEGIPEFIENQMNLIESFCSSHIRKIKENLLKSASEWENKGKDEEN
jgi:hypothetical protein